MLRFDTLSDRIQDTLYTDFSRLKICPENWYTDLDFGIRLGKSAIANTYEISNFELESLTRFKIGLH